MTDQHENHNEESTTNPGFASNIMSEMTVDEVRKLHTRALSEAEAKRTELRLVVTSRYRELVGSSDEVMVMQKEAAKLYDIVNKLPGCLEDVSKYSGEALDLSIRNRSKLEKNATLWSNETSSSTATEAATSTVKKDGVPPKMANVLYGILKQHDFSPVWIRKRLAKLPRRAHRALDNGDPNSAAIMLVEAFTLIAMHNPGVYPLADSLSLFHGKTTSKDGDEYAGLKLKDHASIGEEKENEGDDEDDALQEEVKLLACQVHMVYLHIQSLPARTIRLAHKVLLQPSTSPGISAGALATLALLDPAYKDNTSNTTAQLVDVYYNAKSKLLSNLLSVHDNSPQGGGGGGGNNNINLEDLTSNLHTVLQVIQHDLVLDSSAVFLHMLPIPPHHIIDLDQELIQSKCSRFLAAHLPLLRNRMRNILSSVSTASYLATIRQSLYDQTLNLSLQSNWQSAVKEVVDLRVVLTKTSSASLPASFSLWSILFSQTFDSLVEGLLRHSCVSLHSTVISSLRRSLALAPPQSQIRAHEAHRNCLLIASTLDASLRNLHDDAWKLVHHEERDVSSVALKQSLFVQTCETMARLLCELRFICDHSSSSSQSQQDVNSGTTDLIVGRLCYLLKYRLTSLQTLLDPSSAPVSSAGSGGRITIHELEAAFEIEDDDDDGLLSIDEAREAMEAAFSGTSFGGADMVSSMPSSSSNTGASPSSSSSSSSSSAPVSLTFMELALLAARGLKHDEKENNALTTIQLCLDSILHKCFQRWSTVSLSKPTADLNGGFQTMKHSWNVSDLEWRRLHGHEEQNDDNAEEDVDPEEEAPPESMKNCPLSVSSFIMAFLLTVSSELNRVICPKDFLPPVSMASNTTMVSETLVSIIRVSLLKEALSSITSTLQDNLLSNNNNEEHLEECCESSLLQILLDVGFVQRLFERTKRFAEHGTETDATRMLALQQVSTDISDRVGFLTLEVLKHKILQTQNSCLSSCNLFLSPLFGEEDSNDNKHKQPTESLHTSMTMGTNTSNATTTAAVIQPLTSSRRFALLPIQSERQLNELQHQALVGGGGGGGNYGNRNAGGNSTERNSTASTSSSGASGSGFGFFTSMKWKT